MTIPYRREVNGMSPDVLAAITELVIEHDQPVIVYKGANGQVMVGVLDTMPDVDWELTPVPAEQINMLGYAEYVAEQQSN